MQNDSYLSSINKVESWLQWKLWRRIGRLSGMIREVGLCTAIAKHDSTEPMTAPMVGQDSNTAVQTMQCRKQTIRAEEIAAVKLK